MSSPLAFGCEARSVLAMVVAMVPVAIVAVIIEAEAEREQR